jgi:hypothetical protein
MYAVILAIVFISWYRSEGRLDIHNMEPTDCAPLRTAAGGQ